MVNLTSYYVTVINNLLAGAEIAASFRFSRNNNYHVNFITVIDGRIHNVNKTIQKMAYQIKYDKRYNDLSFYALGEDGLHRTLYEMGQRIMEERENFAAQGVNVALAKDEYAFTKNYTRV